MEWSMDTVPNLYKIKYGEKKMDKEKDKDESSFRDKLISVFSAKPDAAKETEDKITKNVGAGITEKAKLFKFGAR